ncbi:hypothetical protein K1719_024629 [Acacia pycnantha]|nr:hypothetical protein K1719_024629 [Acacia pycnantha]
MRSHVPPFGSWDWNDNLPFTQCFESATQAGFFRCTFSDHSSDQDHRDLYVAGDLYQNDVVTLAMIVVPRKRKTLKTRRPRVSTEKIHYAGIVLCFRLNMIHLGH